MADEKDPLETTDEEVEIVDPSDTGDKDPDTDSDEADDVDLEEDADLSEEDVKQSKNLFRLLKDPQTRANTLRILATKEGILKEDAPPQTQREVDKAQKSIKELVKEKFGKDYAFISDIFGETLQLAFEQEREYTRAQLNTVQIREVEREASSALEKLSRETKGESTKFMPAMTKLMDSIKPSKDLSQLEYFRHLYTIASSGKRIASTKAQLDDKIRRNSNNAAERLQSRGTSTGKDGTPPGGPAQKGIKAAVEFAFAQLNKK